jgi:membrane fusion protein, multidrug efflux system
MKSAREGGTFPVFLGLATEPGEHPHKGFINFRENTLNPNTGTIRLRARFDNPKPEKGPRLLTPGLFARIRFPFGTEYAALHLPEQAIGTDQGRKFVYVVDADNRVSERKVTVGPVRDGWIVIREGLSLEDRVIVKGLQRVRPKSIVKPKEVVPDAEKAKERE